MTTERKPQDAKVIVNNQPANETKIKFSEAVLLAGVSGSAYLFCFYYESGYADFFGIPIQLINISLVNLLVFASITISFILALFPTVNYIFTFLPRNHPYLSFYVPRFLMVLAFSIIFVLMLRPSVEWKYIILFLGTPILLFAIPIFILPLIVHRKKGTYLERYQAEDEVRLKARPTLLQQVANKTGDTPFLIIGMLVMSTALANTAGRSKASKQIEFPVTNSNPEMIVLVIYGDNMICAPFDRQTHEVKKTFSILKVAEDSKLVISIEGVGPLKSVDKLTKESITTPTPEPTSVTPTPAPTPNK